MTAPGARVNLQEILSLFPLMVMSAWRRTNSQARMRLSFQRLAAPSARSASMDGSGTAPTVMGWLATELQAHSVMRPAAGW